MIFMKRAWSWLRSIPSHYWMWALAKLSLGLGWGHAIAIYPPTSYDSVVDLSTILRLGVSTMVGGVMGAFFMFLSYTRNTRRRRFSVWMELVGSILLAGGPLQYLAIQVGFMIDGSFQDRYALAWFAWSLLCFVMVRIVMLMTRLRKDATLRVHKGGH